MQKKEKRGNSLPLQLPFVQGVMYLEFPFFLCFITTCNPDSCFTFIWQPETKAKHYSGDSHFKTKSLLSKASWASR